LKIFENFGREISHRFHGFHCFFWSQKGTKNTKKNQAQVAAEAERETRYGLRVACCRLPKLTKSGGAEERKDWVPDKGVLGSSLRYEGQAEFLDAD